jgi:hypothetical protein
MTQRERKVFHNCKVVRKSQEEHNGNEVWTVTLDKDVFGGKWDPDITRVEPEVANHLERGQQYSLVLERQNKKKAEYDGNRDWMYYWGITGIADGAPPQQAERPTNGAAPRQTTTTSESWGTLDERIAWNSAINNAVGVVPFPGSSGRYDDEGVATEWLGEVNLLAQDIYALIRRGPTPAAEDAPSDASGDVSESTYIEDILDEQEPF